MLDSYDIDEVSKRTDIDDRWGVHCPTNVVDLSASAINTLPVDSSCQTTPVNARTPREISSTPRVTPDWNSEISRGSHYQLKTQPRPTQAIGYADFEAAIMSASNSKLSMTHRSCHAHDLVYLYYGASITIDLRAPLINALLRTPCSENSIRFLYGIWTTRDANTATTTADGKHVPVVLRALIEANTEPPKKKKNLTQKMIEGSSAARTGNLVSKRYIGSMMLDMKRK